MYSGWSPFLRVKFWKKEFVGGGVESRFGEKKLEGSGRTVECACGNVKGDDCFVLRGIIGGGDGDRSGGGGGNLGGRDDGVWWVI